jgi:adenosylcobinamide-GDP ribazoletransferase
MGMGGAWEKGGRMAQPADESEALDSQQQSPPFHGEERARAPQRWRWLQGLLLAVTFLTVLPVRMPEAAAPATSEPAGMAKSLPWFPLVGALIGAVLALVDWALTPLLALGVRDALLLAVAALLTGMLHLDGFIDCCDALLGTRSVARRLEILRDSRIGAYGAIGAGLLLLARFAALGALGAPIRVLALVMAPLAGRWSMVYAVARFPYARAAGTGTPFQAPRPRLARTLALATLGAGLLLLAICGLGSGSGLGERLALAGMLALVAIGVTLGWTRWASRRLGGGLTGDTYGALNELVELAVLALAPPLVLLAIHLLHLR